MAKIAAIPDDIIHAMLPSEFVELHRGRSLSPDRPVLRGSAQNPDVFFQAREASNPFYVAMPDIVANVMSQFASATGRAYRLFEYVGAPDAERVIVLMGSGAGAAEEAVESLVARGEPVGLLKVRLFRPFSAAAFVATLPPTVRNWLSWTGPRNRALWVSLCTRTWSPLCRKRGHPAVGWIRLVADPFRT
jgi:pyruvate-ferredoxin/flavodoxin oxidoreductase